MARRRVTIADIAARADVHRSTVSLALRGSPRIPDDTRERIERIAVELGYLPNLVARGLAVRRTNAVGLLVPELEDDFYVTVVSHQEQWLRARNMMPLLVVTKIRGAVELPALDELVGRGVDGFVFNYFPSDARTRERVAQIVRGGTPVAMFGNRDIEGVDYVFYDTIAMGYEVTRHLLELGHRRIAILTWSMHNRRMEGYRRALKEAGIAFDRSLVFLIHYTRQDISYLHKEIMALKERPTAIFAYCDDLAAEVMNNLVEADYRIPEDVSVAGFDDCWFSRVLRVPLTTMRLPQQEMAEALVEMLMNRIESGDKEGPLAAQFRTFEGELVVRQSTGPPPGAC